MESSVSEVLLFNGTLGIYVTVLEDEPYTAFAILNRKAWMGVKGRRESKYYNDKLGYAKALDRIASIWQRKTRFKSNRNFHDIRLCNCWLKEDYDKEQ